MKRASLRPHELLTQSPFGKGRELKKERTGSQPLLFFSVYLFGPVACPHGLVMYFTFYTSSLRSVQRSYSVVLSTDMLVNQKGNFDYIKNTTFLFVLLTN